MRFRRSARLSEADLPDRFAMNSMPIISVKPRRRVAPAFALLIGIVFQNGAKPEMIGIYAGRIISPGAVVQHAQPFGNCSPMDQPTGTMRLNRTVSETPPTDESVALGISISRPYPALLFLLNEAPESFDKSLRKPLSSEDWVSVKKAFPAKAIASKRDSATLFAHNQFVWLCHASDSSTCAEALSFSQSGCD